MGQQRYTPEFKDEAVKQVTESGHSVQEVAARLGVSSHSLYKWVKSVRPSEEEQRGDELLDAKKEILTLRVACTGAYRAPLRNRTAPGGDSQCRCRSVARSVSCAPATFGRALVYCTLDGCARSLLRQLLPTRRRVMWISSADSPSWRRASGSRPQTSKPALS